MNDSPAEVPAPAGWPPDRGTLDFWVAWIVATIGGAFAGFVVLAVLAVGMAPVMRSIFGTNLDAFLAVCGVIVGLGIGVLQGRVLSGVLGRAVWRQWTVLTIIGVTAALFAVRLASPIIEGLYTGFNRGNGFMALSVVAIAGGAVGGLVLGCVQWLVLRRYVARAAWWILSSMVAIAAGATSGILIVSAQSASDNYADYVPSGVMYTYLACAACIPWPVIAAVTGWTLVELLKRPGKSSVNISA
ncbi:MAG TPA: hypothetical protein VF914_23365 [Chloroflexia bacterium]